MPMPVPCATPAGRLRRIQERTPVTEIAVKTTPIRKIAPSATAGESPCPSTSPKAVKAVSEIAQPMAMGSLAHMPISKEPKAAVRQVATNTALVSKPALPSIPGTTNTEYTMAMKVVTPANASRRPVLPRALIWKYRSRKPLTSMDSMASMALASIASVPGAVARPGNGCSSMAECLLCGALGRRLRRSYPGCLAFSLSLPRPSCGPPRTNLCRARHCM